jgi:hypothetical protein
MEETMMTNQVEIRSMRDVTAAMDAGNYDVADRYLRGEFADLPDDIEEDEAGFVNGVAPVAEEGGASELPNDGDEEDPLEAQRRVHDEMLNREKALREEFERKTAELERQMEKKMQDRIKELEAEKKRFTLPEDDDDEGFEDVELKLTNLEAKAEAAGSEAPDDVRKELELTRKELRDLVSNMEFERTVDSYNAFWQTERGAKLKPEGNVRDAINNFVSFYERLMAKVGDDKKAKRLMQDIAVRGKGAETVQSLGIELPKDFSKLWKSYEVELYAKGEVVDKITGEVKKAHDNKYRNLEDAYVLLYKDEPLLNAKKEAFESIQKKMNEKSSSARTISPDKYSTLEPRDKYMDQAYTTDLVRRAKASGLDMRRDTNTIKDPSIRNEYREYEAFLASLR